MCTYKIDVIGNLTNGVLICPDRTFAQTVEEETEEDYQKQNDWSQKEKEGDKQLLIMHMHALESIQEICNGTGLHSLSIISPE